MISLIGFVSLFFSFIFSAVIIITYFYNIKNYSNKIFFYSIYISTFCIIISFFSLIFAYVYSDFSNFNVFQNSHSSKPLIYKISGTWGNHEGSMLLWLTIMLLYSFFFSFNQSLQINLKKLTIVFHSSLYICFALFVILTSNPFLVNSIKVDEGLGLNPILQDPALSIHPPILYIGYVGFSLILSLSLAGMLLNKIDNKWVYVTKNWALFCWSMLSGGIALGVLLGILRIRVGWLVVLGSCRKCIINALDCWPSISSLTNDHQKRAAFKKVDCFSCRSYVSL